MCSSYRGNDGKPAFVNNAEAGKIIFRGSSFM